MREKYQEIIRAELAANKVAVVIPCYKVKKHVIPLVRAIKAPVRKIYCVDDGCPEKSGKHIEKHVKDKRVRVIYHKENKGVGGAVKTGYREALEDGMDIIVKLDGDGQMDPALIPLFIQPILLGHADYTKGNRFFNPEGVKQMPKVRLFGNAGLSFLTKLSSGYWHMFDPNNGFTAVHAETLRALPLEKLADGYFFESDLLFRLNTIGAVVQDVPMEARYGEEQSSLRVGSSIGLFLGRNLRNFLKRIFYNYFLRDFNLGSLELLAGLPLLAFGIIFGGLKWFNSIESGVAVTPGTVMVAALPIILGAQLLIAFLAYDTQAKQDHPYFLRSRKLNKLKEKQMKRTTCFSD